jgi:hypothetical protein
MTGGGTFRFEPRTQSVVDFRLTSELGKSLDQVKSIRAELRFQENGLHTGSEYAVAKIPDLPRVHGQQSQAGVQSPTGILVSFGRRAILGQLPVHFLICFGFGVGLA